MKVFELLSDEKNWIKKAFARDASDNVVMSTDSTACKWCLEGAIKVCYDTGEQREDARKKLITAIMEHDGRKRSLEGYNDDKKTTHEDIKIVTKKAGI